MDWIAEDPVQRPGAVWVYLNPRCVDSTSPTDCARGFIMSASRGAGHHGHQVVASAARVYFDARNAQDCLSSAAEVSMSRSPLNLPFVLDQVSAAFGVTEIRNPTALASAQQTGFVWTRQPGVVCLAANRRYFAMARDNPDVVAIVVPPAVAEREDAAAKGLVVSERAEELYHRLHLAQHSEAAVADRFEIDGTAFVDASAILRGHVQIEAGARIGPRVVISGPARIGRNARIEAGAVIGCNGLYAKMILGVRRQMPHFGSVDVGDGAQVLAGAVVARSAIRGEATRIGPGAHVGILSNIGHDVEIGEAAMISSNVVVAGRVTVGARAWIGASATISNRVVIGEDAEVRLGAVVVQDVPAGGDVSGNFALDHARHMKRFLRDVRNES